MNSNVFNILAIAAPQWVDKPNSEFEIQSLTSATPFSLQNALRLACLYADRGVGYLGESNWKSMSGRQESILLYEYFEIVKEDFVKKILKDKPQVLLIGTMTLGFAGAIELAKIAKTILNNDILIILGGKHIIETSYLSGDVLGGNMNCTLRLMKDKVIDNVFDIVISGDGEEIIYRLLEYVGELVGNGQNIFSWIEGKDEFFKAKGDWLLGWLDDTNEIKYFKSNIKELDQDKLPFPIELFEVNSNFSVFDAEFTAHAYSYMGKGCPFDCFFCSEKRSINGKLNNLSGAAQRLVRQFEIIQDISVEKWGNKNASAFIEDSILLGGNYKLLQELDYLMESKKMYLKFGGQFTLDTLLSPNNKEIITKLADKGLYYVFIGMETVDENIALKMSKNTTKKNLWLDRNEEAICFLNSIGIKTGFSVLFGLGESIDSRLMQLEQLESWQQKYGAPHVVSLNFATLHPLQDAQLNNKVTYTTWGTSKNSEYLSLFIELFGEASVEYCLPNVKLPSISELLSIKKIFERIEVKNANKSILKNKISIL